MDDRQPRARRPAAAPAPDPSAGERLAAATNLLATLRAGRLRVESLAEQSLDLGGLVRVIGGGGDADALVDDIRRTQDMIHRRLEVWRELRRTGAAAQAQAVAEQATAEPPPLVPNGEAPVPAPQAPAAAPEPEQSRLQGYLPPPAGMAPQSVDSFEDELVAAAEEPAAAPRSSEPVEDDDSYVEPRIDTNASPQGLVLGGANLLTELSGDDAAATADPTEDDSGQVAVAAVHVGSAVNGPRVSMPRPEPDEEVETLNDFELQASDVHGDDISDDVLPPRVPSLAAWFGDGSTADAAAAGDAAADSAAADAAAADAAAADAAAEDAAAEDAAAEDAAAEDAAAEDAAAEDAAAEDAAAAGAEDERAPHDVASSVVASSVVAESEDTENDEEEADLSGLASPRMVPSQLVIGEGPGARGDEEPTRYGVVLPEGALDKPAPSHEEPSQRRVEVPRPGNEGHTDQLAAVPAQDDFLDEESSSYVRRSGGLSVALERPDSDDDGEEDSAELHAPRLTDDEPVPSLTSFAAADAVLSEVEEVVDEERLAEFLGDATELERRGDLHGAIVSYSDAVELAPDRIEGFLGRGRAHLELGDYSSAMSDFQRAEDLAPGRSDPLIEMGNLYFARKEYRRAIEFYDQALEIDGGLAMARCRRGICHHYRRNHKAAFQDLQKAYALDPDIPNIRKYVQMAVKAMEKGRGRR